MTRSRSKSSRATAAPPAPREPAATTVPDAALVRVGLADDHALFRRDLRTRLESEADFQVVGEAASPDETVALCSADAPDVLMLDIAMGGADGLALLERLRDLELDTRVLMLATEMPRRDLIRALQLGARGVVLKQAPPELLVKSIRRVRAGEFWVGRDIVADLVQALAALEKSASRAALPATRAFALTARELEIVAAVASGHTNRQIARKFAIAEDTIKHHLTSIFGKTGVSNRLELAVFAIHNRLA